MNSPLIERLYEKEKDDYKDLRSLHTIKAMTKRIDTLKARLRKMPAEKKKLSNKAYKRLVLECRLLLIKKALYEDKSPIMTIVRWKLQLSDRHSYQDKESLDQRISGKKEHLLPLLHLMYIKQTDEQLQARLDS